MRTILRILERAEGYRPALYLKIEKMPRSVRNWKGLASRGMIPCRRIPSASGTIMWR